MLNRRQIRFVAAILFLLGCTPSFAQQSNDSEKATIQALLQEVKDLRARVEKLEAEKEAKPAPQVVEAAMQNPQATPQPAPELSPETEAPGEHATEMERMDPGKTLLRMRGFGDVTFHGTDHRGDTTSFTLGQLDLFITSDVSEKFRFLSEIVFEGDQNNNYGVDIERLLMQYAPKDWFNISVGRYHTAIGYYNTAYHHSTWLQTTTGRPFLFEFEDKGGILPVHNVGVSVTGQLPTGSLGLHYIAEIGNGRASRDPVNQEAVQNVIDENNRKAMNVGLFARPQWLQGLQAGVSVYHDLLQPNNSPRIAETIVAGHVVYVRPNFEWLNEAMVIRHDLHDGGRTYNTPGFYTQFSKRFGSYRPYLRYQYLNVANTEPVFSDVGLRHGPSVGIRYDPTESVALKLQYDYTAQRNHESFNGLAAQIGFTF